MASNAHRLATEQFETALCGSTNGLAVTTDIALEWCLAGNQCSLVSRNSLGHRLRRCIAAIDTVELLLVCGNRIQFGDHFVHRRTHFAGCGDWAHVARQSRSEEHTSELQS